MSPEVEPAPTVSVVTPVYNGARYLAECIESVRAQTHDDWEYVVVDNCSTDGTAEIADRYAAEDPRIRVHRSDEFRAVIENWNHAVRQISPSSTYTKVVHADDVLFPECIERMVALADAHPSVGVVGALRLSGDVVDLDGVVPYPTSVVSGREICRHSLLGGRYIFGTPSSLLIRSSLIRERDPFYNEAHLHADTEVCYDLLQDSDFGFVHQVLTYTRKHDDSVTSATRRQGTWLPDHFAMFLTYGPIYLDEADFDRRLRQMLRRYHTQLLRNTARRRPGDDRFLQHQRRMLAEISGSIDSLPTRRGSSLRLWPKVLGLANRLQR